MIGTGYNEGSNLFGQNFDLIVAAARAKGAVRIVWMNYRLRDGLTRAGTDNNGSYVSNNATLLQKVASGAYPDVFIADWRDYSAPVRSWFVPDGIHYQPTGALGSADYISRWITYLFDEPCPKPMTVGGPIDNPCTPPDGSPPPDVTPSTADPPRFSPPVECSLGHLGGREHSHTAGVSHRKPDGGSAEFGEALLEVADALGDAPLVLDQGEPGEAFAAGTEADAGRQCDLALADDVRAELDRVHVGVRLRDRRPHEHRALRLRDLPADAAEPVDQAHRGGLW